MSNKVRLQLLIVAILAGAAVITFLLPRQLSPVEISAAGGGERPEVIELTGTVRDFREWDMPGGHPDFDGYGREVSWLGCGYGHYAGNVANTLPSTGKPVFTGGGFRVASPWEDAVGHPICHTLYDASRGDREGRKACDDDGGIASAESFHSWYRDVPGLNISPPLTLAFVLQPDGTYVFDSDDDPRYRVLGGFFPIDHRLFGNSPLRRGRDHNYHFTFELHASFVYSAAEEQMFQFVGDDDVWVYIDSRKVIDLGGVHDATEQFVDLDRLGLTDGETYALSFFFAERNRVASNFRAVTNIALESEPIPPITAAYD